MNGALDLVFICVPQIAQIPRTLSHLSLHRASPPSLWNRYQYLTKSSLRSANNNVECLCKHSIRVQTASSCSSLSRAISEANVPICPFAHSSVFPSVHLPICPSVSAWRVPLPSGKKCEIWVFSFQTNQTALWTSLPAYLVLWIHLLREKTFLGQNSWLEKCGSLISHRCWIKVLPCILGVGWHPENHFW